MADTSDSGNGDRVTEHIFVTGGVVSSVGKGLTAASLGNLLTARGLRVVMQKLDPYLNVDPGTMNPFQHGEVFVTEDGAECDLDIGHYERFLGVDLLGTANVTTGQVYSRVIARERRGEYLGDTVQVIPHISDEIKRRMRLQAEADPQPDVIITEIGGTVGDIESQPFIEAARDLEAHGVRAITTSCGFLAAFHRELAAAVSVPMLTSSLLQAPLVARLRAAGAVILGKTNLSEWANIRSNNSMSGWSAVRGLVKNPYALDRTACGSSSGSGSAIAASRRAATCAVSPAPASPSSIARSPRCGGRGTSWRRCCSMFQANAPFSLATRAT